MAAIRKSLYSQVRDKKGISNASKLNVFAVPTPTSTRVIGGVQPPVDS